ncbi:right-handed parallel beta-helix repeat-containing protein [Nocardia sp. NBC_00508]|uniref:right-handed parallel beta-helix repeat-containing protein n=1 Tax=Nocardia sp. NBC_00508 TaxID=2975992 RepID=UPI002E81A13B|nr:right-handed parallel beta-helix repeat-containing protein [Nocardia sp. NBC_00508]WUD65962.1 right-handed parallel beta-helix repeat-containing protein [Nocardia sp. NBC_00508]
MPELFVDPLGDDSAPGTRDRPFATLGRAQVAARTLAAEVIVQLRDGTHVLNEPWELTAADSGKVVYQPYGYGTAAQEKAVVSGGRLLTGWRVDNGVWLAEVGHLNTRQLYVNGRRAERAGVDGLPGRVTMTETGYVTDSAEPLSWHSPGDVEFVHRGVYPWTEARCGVASVSASNGGTVITMAQPAFGRALALYNSTWEGQTSRGPGLPTHVENDSAFLAEPGTFVLDRSHPGRHIVRYLPRPGEHPDRTPVVAPALETLLRVSGVSGVTFRGLTFADATWLRPSGPEGFLHYHGSGFYAGGPVHSVSLGEGIGSVTVPAESATIPACLVLEEVFGVRIEDCNFTRLGATGLGISGGADVTVRACDFDTLSAGALVVDGSKSTLVENNRVHRVGLEFSGSPGIALTGTIGCTVAHNHIADVPHCGIVAGPGRKTAILRNLTTGTMQVLADGGGIYLAGEQGDSHGSGANIQGNVIEDTRTPYNFGLYIDYGATWVTVEENVVVRADSTAILHVSPPLDNVVYRGNFWDVDPIGADAPPPGVTYEDNTTITDRTEPEAMTAVRARAGLLRKPPTAASA